jgi:hypothetical protein
MRRNRIILVGVGLVFAVAGMYKAQNRDSRGKCSNASLIGSYGLGATGEILGVGPFAAVGILTFDGNGNLVGTSRKNQRQYLSE